MEAIFSEEKQKIYEAIKKKAILPCPRCGTKNFTLLDGYFNQGILQKLTSDLTIGGPTVPSVVVLCSNCGYMSQHALGVLELMPTNEEKK